MRNKYVFVVSLLVVLTICSVIVSSLGGRARQNKEGLLIVTSFYPVYIAALNAAEGIEGVQIRCLSAPSAGCVHDHQLTTEDMRLLEQADVFIVNGGGMESYLETVIERYPKLRLIDSSKGIMLLESGDAHEHEGHTHEEEETIYNAHIWMNMEKYCIQIDNIGNELIEMDPVHKDSYGVNIENYKRKIKELLKEGQQELAGVSVRSAVSTHEAFSYFAENFQWELAATVNMDENTSLKAAELRDVIRAIQSEGIPYIFTEEIYGISLSRVLEQETDCQMILLDTLVTGKVDKDAYLKGMRQNITAVKEAVEYEEAR